MTAVRPQERIEGFILNALTFQRILLLARVGIVTVGALNAPRLWAQSSAAATSPEFDVASIKPSQAARAGGEGSRREDISSSPGSLIMRSVSVASCIKWAYGVQDYQVDGPGWINLDRFDIVAKAVGPVPDSQRRLMLQALLADRFKLALHRQSMERSVYALVLAKNGPKLRQADGESENGVGVMRPGKLGVRAEKTSMSEFAAFLSGPVQTPVVDMTGLKGRFDFTLDLASFFVGAGPGKQDQPSPDMTSIIFTALQEQLGLKLESTKGPVDVLVIDHVEHPTEN